MKKNKLWIETYSGKKINPLSARKNDIDIEDIAHSLAMQCRFNGHCKEFYSVAEHCINTAEYLSSVQDQLSLSPLFALLHDASEAYLCDIPRPLKAYINDYLKWEKDISAIIFAKFAKRQPSKDEWDLVMQADNALLAIEATKLAFSGGKMWNLSKPAKNKVKIRCLKWQEAKRLFLRRFIELSKNNLRF